MTLQLLELQFESLELLHFFEEGRLFGADVEFDDLHLGGEHLVPFLSGFQLLLLGLELLFSHLVALLLFPQLLLSCPHLFLPFRDFLHVGYFLFDVGLINPDDFLVQFLDLYLEILDFFVHAFNIEFSLPKVLSPFVLLLL